MNNGNLSMTEYFNERLPMLHLRCDSAAQPKMIDDQTKYELGRKDPTAARNKKKKLHPIVVTDYPDIYADGATSHFYSDVYS